MSSGHDAVPSAMYDRPYACVLGAKRYRHTWGMGGGIQETRTGSGVL